MRTVEQQNKCTAREVKWEKMSKSRGNVVLPDEVVGRIFEMHPTYEIRNRNNILVDWRAIGAWRHYSADGMFYADSQHGRIPLFLHEIGNPIPCMLEIGDTLRLQHPEDLEFWDTLLTKYDTEKASCELSK